MQLPEKNWLEWLVFGISLLLVLGTLGFLGYDATQQTGNPPDIVVELGTPQQASQHYLVPVSVTNKGDDIAEEVTVQVSLERAGEEPEDAEFTVAMLPRDATREGWVTFTDDPSSGTMQIHVLGFERP